ncbi:MAG: hypothetical protein IJU80_10010, partial [Lachnospiraceae bacterium]|nr:hypothetical protein [Lachnospiraceae bacterium]
ASAPWPFFNLNFVWRNFLQEVHKQSSNFPQIPTNFRLNGLPTQIYGGESCGKTSKNADFIGFFA